MKIKCAASIYDAYYKVVEISVGMERKRKIFSDDKRTKDKNKYTYLADNAGETLGKCKVKVQFNLF